MSNIREKVVVDTTYLLPFFGVKVKNINSDILYELHEMDIVLLYPKLLITELAAKIAKEAIKKGLAKPPKAVFEAIDALLLETDIRLVEPERKHLETAIKLRIIGHKDMFDNLLYATALHENAYLLTIDSAFIDFLEKHELSREFIIDHNKLRNLLLYD